MRLVDPVTLIVSALAVGSAAGLRDTADHAIREAYGALKRAISQRYKSVDLAPVERRPQSQVKRASLEEDLGEAGAGEDRDLLDAARRVIEEVRRHDAAAGEALGIDLARVEAEFLHVRGVEATGTGVRVREGTFRGGIDLQDIRAGRGGPPGDP
jgi:hypothetical protein